MSLIPDIPVTHTAILQHQDGELKVTSGVPIPTVRAGWLLVRNAAVCLNPCDFKIPARFPFPGLMDGVDFAGTVAAVGEGVADFRVEDRVFGCTLSNDPDDPEKGTFGQYVKVESYYALKIPDTMSFEEAAALSPSCICTIALALHQVFKLPATPDDGAYPQSRSLTFLVYGGSSSVGLVAIQLLKLCRHHVITTCSPHNFNLVKSYGADAVFDYHSKTCAADIRAYTQDRLKLVIDPFGEVATTSFCYGAIGRAGGMYCALEQYEESCCTRRTVKHHLVVGLSILGHGVRLPEPYGVAPDSELEAWCKDFHRSLQRLVDQSLLRSLPIRKLKPAGLDTVLRGLELLKTKQVSGQKLVVSIT